MNGCTMNEKYTKDFHANFKFKVVSVEIDCEMKLQQNIAIHH